ncbi:hypothetical protein [Labilibaculum antarcticum]|uniref:Uncharacterized protein n=1 Tax=Labilibaculum antarcticum TaxID=1717717 RepID=A0A1Y1CQY7_9BACT|nr:hypothetical protein [Labilibaculum antarcticum]BAX81661.1 hypothetical protein ALGA_3363 [Labilibaculum antarcticum]
MKKTIKLLTLVLTMFLSTAVFAQECEYEINEVDKFTKEKKVVTKPVMVAKSLKIAKILKIKTVKWKVKNENNRKYLMTSYNLSKGSIVMVGSEKLILLLRNNESISLNINSLIPNMQGKFNSYVAEFTYNLTDEDLAKLVKYDVKDIRVEAMINGFDYNLIDEVSTKSIFKCIN